MALERYLSEPTRRDWQRADAAGEPVRVAAVGLGWWTRDRAIPALRDSAFCEPTVVVSGSAEKARQVADAVDSVTHAMSYDQFRAGEATDAYDAAYVATPNATHLDYVAAAADHGKAILCEKPMEATVERAARAVDACADAGVPFMIAYRMQTEPAVRRMRELVREGVIGDPVAVHGHMTQRLLELIPDPDQWRLNPDLAGTGASVTDLGVYPINTARFVLDADPVAVQARCSSHAEAFARVPDERATFRLAFPDGVAAACTASQNAQESSAFRVVGTEGELALEPAFFSTHPRELTLTRGESSTTVRFPNTDQMREEFDYFGERLQTGEPIHPDGAHGLVDVRIIQAVYEASETGERVALET